MSGSRPSQTASLPLEFGNAALAALEGSSKQSLFQDCEYGDHVRQRMDVYAPRVERSGVLRPTMLFLYGGGWTGGAKANYAFVGTALARLGFVTAVADYRLHPDVTFPAFIEDSALALAWLSRRACDFGGRSDGIVVAGHSAGAHLAMLLALNPRYLAAAGLGRETVGGVVGLSGPYDFYPYPNDLCRDVFGAVEPAYEVQPINFAEYGAFPVILASGGRDKIVPAANSFSMANARRKAQRRCFHLHSAAIGPAGPLLALTRPFQRLLSPLRQRLTHLRQSLEIPGLRHALRL